MRWLVIVFLWTPLFGQITADHHNRDNTTAAIPKSSQGAATISHLGTSGVVATLTNGGFKVSHEYMSLAQIWANCPSPCTPSYTGIDGITNAAAVGGYKISVAIEYTPPDLASGTCSGGAAGVPPTNNATWATRAAALIAHVDSGHPGLVTYWTVWNEPDQAVQFCPATGTALQAYLPLYAAAAPAMIAQVIADGQTALVGGPALGSPAAASTWLANTSTGLLGNSGTAPYVQIVDYHLYLGGCTVSWSACFTALQDASTGQNARYTAIDTLVRAGSQPNAATTRINLTEYNDSAPFAADPVRNDPTNGPLWNAVFTINSQNSINSGATTIPQENDYYEAASSGSATFFCQIGNTTAGDCSQPPLNPYPQYYLYQLVNAPQFLNLAAGGHLAASISPGSSTSGLQCSAFYTAQANAILCANPTASPITSGTITFNNAGFSAARGTSYLLNSSNATITGSNAALTTISGGFTMAPTSIPAMSTMAFSITNLASIVNSGAKLSSGANIQ